MSVVMVRVVGCITGKKRSKLRNLISSSRIFCAFSLRNDSIAQPSLFALRLCSTSLDVSIGYSNAPDLSSTDHGRFW